MSGSRRNRRAARSEHIVKPHANDVLNGRGVKIANHPGNLRFRSLVKQFKSEVYCAAFSSSEKKALACQIIDHIEKLTPPGRFLKQVGDDGPWVRLSTKDVEKKTKQALRDCNRLDREGYAEQVQAPQDVDQVGKERERAGLTVQEIAQTSANELSRRGRPRDTNRNQRSTFRSSSRSSRQSTQRRPTSPRTEGFFPNVHDHGLEAEVHSEAPFHQMEAATAPQVTSSWSDPAAMPSTIHRTPATRPPSGPAPVTQTPNPTNYAYSSANNDDRYELHHGSQRTSNPHAGTSYHDQYEQDNSLSYYHPSVAQSIGSVPRTGSPIGHSPILSSARNTEDVPNDTFGDEFTPAHPRQNLFGDDFAIHHGDEFDSMAANAANSLHPGTAVDDIYAPVGLGFLDDLSHQQTR